MKLVIQVATGIILAGVLLLGALMVIDSSVKETQQNALEHYLN